MRGRGEGGGDGELGRGRRGGRGGEGRRGERGGEGRGSEGRGKGRGWLEHLQVAISAEKILDSESPEDKDF